MFGVPVRLHFTFILFAVFLTVSVLSSPHSDSNYAIFMVGGLASLLLHEFGHAFVAARFGVRTTEIVMFPIGGLARLERRLRPGEELWVTLAGPAANLALAGAIFGWMAVTRQPVTIGLSDLLTPSDGAVLQRLAFANLLVAALNLMPAFPMDGGRVVRALPHRAPAALGPCQARRHHADRHELQGRAGECGALPRHAGPALRRHRRVQIAGNRERGPEVEVRRRRVGFEVRRRTEAVSWFIRTGHTQQADPRS